MIDITNHVVGRTLFGGRPKLSDEAKLAMRLVESLVNGGLIQLGDDPFVSGQQRFQMRSTGSSESVHAIEGEAMSFALDPLEQAIELTTRVLRDEREHLAHISMTLSGDVQPSPVYKRMSSHLEALLDAQLKRVAGHE